MSAAVTVETTALKASAGGWGRELADGVGLGLVWRGVGADVRVSVGVGRAAGPVVERVGAGTRVAGRAGAVEVGAVEVDPDVEGLAGGRSLTPQALRAITTTVRPRRPASREHRFGAGAVSWCPALSCCMLSPCSWCPHPKTLLNRKRLGRAGSLLRDSPLATACMVRPPRKSVGHRLLELSRD
jgi:hypothetical protein